MSKDEKWDEFYIREGKTLDKFYTYLLGAMEDWGREYRRQGYDLDKVREGKTWTAGYYQALDDMWQKIFDLREPYYHEHFMTC